MPASLLRAVMATNNLGNNVLLRKWKQWTPSMPCVCSSPWSSATASAPLPMPWISPPPPSPGRSPRWRNVCPRACSTAPRAGSAPPAPARPTTSAACSCWPSSTHWKPRSARRRCSLPAACASTRRSATASPGWRPCYPASVRATRRWNWTCPCPTAWWTWWKKVTTWPSASPAPLHLR
ncbi:hypothetical protein D3C81_1116730 [compost metagenome]